MVFVTFPLSVGLGKFKESILEEGAPIDRTVLQLSAGLEPHIALLCVWYWWWHLFVSVEISTQTQLGIRFGTL